MKTFINTFKDTTKELFTPSSDKGYWVTQSVYKPSKIATGAAVTVGAIDGAIKGAVGPVGGAVLGAITAFRDVKQMQLMVKSVCEYTLSKEEINNLKL